LLMLSLLFVFNGKIYNIYPNLKININPTKIHIFYIQFFINRHYLEKKFI